MKDPRIDDYIRDAPPFARPILKHLRRIVHAGAPQVQETIKWGMPHFDYKGILCGMAAFQKHCAFGFWRREALGFGRNNKDAMGHFGRITSMDDLPDEQTLLALVRKAAALNEAGPGKTRRSIAASPPVSVPPDLAAALKKNNAARRTWESFSNSRRKDYCQWLTGAKREKTRAARLATALEWLAEGKSLNWRYERPRAAAATAA